MSDDKGWGTAGHATTVISIVLAAATTAGLYSGVKMYKRNLQNVARVAEDTADDNQRRNAGEFLRDHGHTGDFIVEVEDRLHRADEDTAAENVEALAAEYGVGRRSRSASNASFQSARSHQSRSDNGQGASRTNPAGHGTGGVMHNVFEMSSIRGRGQPQGRSGGDGRGEDRRRRYF